MRRLVVCTLAATLAVAASAPAEHTLIKKPSGKRNVQEKVLHMAHMLKYIAKKNVKHEAHGKVAEKAIAEHERVGKLSGKTAQEVVDKIGELFGPSGAAKADMQWTAKENDEMAYGDQLDDEPPDAEADPTKERVHKTRKNKTRKKHEGIKEVEEVDGAFQGDMVSSSTAQLNAWKGLSTNGVREQGYTTWTDNYVPYCYANDVADAVVEAMNHAIGQFNKVLPCLVFEDVGRSGDGCTVLPAVYITSRDEGCYANVGMLTSQVTQLNLQSPGCDTVGIAMHEMLHVLGQMHEQSRPDRDDYVTIESDNIQEGMEHNFDISEHGDVNRPYDVLSLMHYSSNAFTVATDGSPTIVGLDAAYCPKYTCDPNLYSDYEMGNRLGMTQSDADQLGEAYGCQVSELTSAPCEDKPLDSGDPFEDSAWGGSGLTCSDYYDILSTGCSAYVSSNFCCQCGGGLTLQEWVAAPPAPTPPPFPPPPSSPPPLPPSSPAPASAQPDLIGGPCCNALMAYCDTTYGVSCDGMTGTMPTSCEKTCSPPEKDTDEYSNCPSLASAGYCSYYFGDGTTVHSRCPESCGTDALPAVKAASVRAVNVTGIVPQVEVNKSPRMTKSYKQANALEPTR